MAEKKTEKRKTEKRGKKAPAKKKEGGETVEKEKIQDVENPRDVPRRIKENSATKRAPRKGRGKRKRETPVEHARGKRKRAIARATVKEGSGRIRVNSRLVSSFGNSYFRGMVEEPLLMLGPDGLKVDVSVSVRGGGEMGQAQACRTAIARALAQHFGEGVVAKYKEDDTYLLREDPRRVEPKKYKGRKARARFQKSYR